MNLLLPHRGGVSNDINHTVYEPTVSVVRSLDFLLVHIAEASAGRSDLRFVERIPHPCASQRMCRLLLDFIAMTHSHPD